MAYKRYAKKNGKVYGPYYYESYRENGVVKKLYIGQKSKTDLVVPQKKTKFLAFSVVALILIAIVFGFIFLSPTGKITLQTQPVYGLNEQISGQAIVILQDG